MTDISRECQSLLRQQIEECISEKAKNREAIKISLSIVRWYCSIAKLYTYCYIAICVPFNNSYSPDIKP